MIIGIILGIIICSMSLIGSYNIKNITVPLDPVIKNKNKTKNYNILIIGVIFTLSFALISTILTYFVSYSISLGMNSLMAASTITVIGASSLIGRLGIRFISAKINNLYLLFFIYLGQFCTFFLLLNNNVYSVFLFAIFFGIAYGSWITIIYSTITKLYSSNKLITFLGSLHLISGTISALSPIAAGYLLDIYIDFTGLFLIFITINFIILILAYLLQLKNKHKS
jgi:MFS family permease